MLASFIAFAVLIVGVALYASYNAWKLKRAEQTIERPEPQPDAQPDGGGGPGEEQEQR